MRDLTSSAVFAQNPIVNFRMMLQLPVGEEPFSTNAAPNIRRFDRMFVSHVFRKSSRIRTITLADLAL